VVTKRPLPIHDVEREIFADRFNNGIPLLILVDEFALVFRSDIEFAAVAVYAFFLIINLTVYKVFYQNFVEFNCHFVTVPFLFESLV
jgi:hypothetical protein